MPGVDGIFVGNELKKMDKNTIIFVVTSKTKYLDDAMRFHAFRYLFKPIDTERLFCNLKDALHLLFSTNIKIPIEEKHEVHVVSSSDIICVEAQNRKVIIHTLEKDYLSIYPMQYWLDVLSMSCFFQTHRSFIVNLKHISKFDHSLVYFNQNPFTAYLTKRKYTALKKAHQLYLQSI